MQLRPWTALEKGSGYHLRYKVSFITAHLLSHDLIVAKSGAHAHHECLIADAAYDFLGILIFFAFNAANHRLVADGPKRSAFRRTLRQVCAELFGDVRHDVDGDAEFANSGTLLPREFADSAALVVYIGCRGYLAAEDPACCRLIDPGALRLRVADGWCQQ